MASQGSLLSELLKSLAADTWNLLKAQALFEVIHDRDMVADRYFRKFIRRDGPSFDDETFPRDCDMLLPRGSDYAPWKGAVSFDILPVWLNGNLYASFATHIVLPHPSRQAYIFSRIFLIDADSSDAPLRLAHEIGRKAHDAALALPEEPGPVQEGWISPFDPRYLNLIAGFFAKWRGYSQNGEWEVMRTFCLSKHMRPERMARELSGYLSRENLAMLRASHRNLVNGPPPDGDRRTVRTVMEPVGGAVSCWSGLFDELIAILRSIIGHR